MRPHPSDTNAPQIQDLTSWRCRPEFGHFFLRKVVPTQVKEIASEANANAIVNLAAIPEKGIGCGGGI